MYAQSLDAPRKSSCAIAVTQESGTSEIAQSYFKKQSSTCRKPKQMSQQNRTSRGPDDHSWIETFLGNRFYPLDPKPEEVHLRDIAHALSLKTRFNGQSAIFYSVAEHAVRCGIYALAVTGNHLFALATLHHDSAEAYLPDVPAPIKPALTNFKEIESGIQTAIHKKFGIDDLSDQYLHELKRIDLRLLATEARDLMTPGALKRWKLPYPPLEESIIPWTHRQAEDRFNFWHKALVNSAFETISPLETLQLYGIIPNYP